MNLKYIFLIFMVLLPFLAGFTNKTDTEKLSFWHYRHYDSQGISCEICHGELNNGVYSLPGHKECSSCHPEGKVNDYKVKAGKTCFKCHPKDDYRNIDLIRRENKKLGRKRSFFHTDKMKNICETCHRAMLEDIVGLGELLRNQSERDRVRRKAHRFYNVDICDDCHRGLSNKAAPKSHKKAGWAGKPHAQFAPEFNCRICHTKSFCQDCHVDSY